MLCSSMSQVFALLCFGLKVHEYLAVSTKYRHVCTRIWGSIPVPTPKIGRIRMRTQGQVTVNGVPSFRGSVCLTMA